jgi:hypothetical protein
LARTGNLRRVRAVVALHEHQSRFLQDLIETVRVRTGIAISRSEILRALVEAAMGLKVSESDIDEAYTKACGLETLRQSRDDIRSEIRDTETELQTMLLESPDDADGLRVFRRNLAYQMRRLAAVEVQIAGWERSADGDGNEAARILQGLLFDRLGPD